MKITVDIDLYEETVMMYDDKGHTYDATPVGHPFFEVCPEHIGYSLNDFLKEIWEEKDKILGSAEYRAAVERNGALLYIVYATLAQLEGTKFEEALQRKLDNYEEKFRGKKGASDEN